jgi:hypothetical protein
MHVIVVIGGQACDGLASSEVSGNAWGHLQYFPAQSQAHIHVVVDGHAHMHVVVDAKARMHVIVDG